jgi:hypothetical protein
VVNGSLEGDDWPLEGEVFEYELNLKLSALEGSGLGSLDEDVPDRRCFLVDDITSR